MLDRRCVYIRSPLFYFGAGLTVGLFFPYIPVLIVSALAVVGISEYLKKH